MLDMKPTGETEEKKCVEERQSWLLPKMKESASPSVAGSTEK